MSLLNVSLSYNNFDGPILEPNASLPANLSLLLMSYNKFSGPVPSVLGQSHSLQFLDLANNSLTGEVPAEVISQAGQINLAFNSFNVSFRNDSRPGFGLFTCNSQVTPLLLSPNILIKYHTVVPCQNLVDTQLWLSSRIFHFQSQCKSVVCAWEHFGRLL